MMRMKTKMAGMSQINGTSAAGGGAGGGGVREVEGRPLDWEVRPGGMLVQKRDNESDKDSSPAPTIRVRVKYGSVYHEITISSQATFGELKKMLVGPTGLHHQDQKLMFKDKERDSKAFLDITGVKDRSKMVVFEDPISQEKRFLEMRRNAKMEKASKSISQISLEADRLAGQVSALESIISKGGKVEEKTLLNLIESLMNQLIKLDGIIGDGDVKLQRKMQVKRVQKYVETLDVLKMKNSIPMPKTNGSSNGKLQTKVQEQPPLSNGHTRQSQIQEHQQQQPVLRHSTSGTVVTTKWETFESTPASLVPLTSSSTYSSIPGTNHSVQPRFNWEFFD